jgi:hypothetical protein
MNNNDYQAQKIKYQGIPNVTPWQLLGRLEDMTKFKAKYLNIKQNTKK